MGLFSFMNQNKNRPLMGQPSQQGQQAQPQFNRRMSPNWMNQQRPMPQTGDPRAMAMQNAMNPFGSMGFNKPGVDSYSYKQPQGFAQQPPPMMGPQGPVQQPQDQLQPRPQNSKLMNPWAKLPKVGY